MRTDSQRATKSRRGLTISEMCVVLALFSIVAVMIASFSVMVDKFVSQQKSQYAFLDEVSQTRQSISQWLSGMDETGTVCKVTPNGLQVDGAAASVLYQVDEQTLTVTDENGTKTQRRTEATQELQFALLQLSESVSIVKCTLTGLDPFEEQTYSQSFVLALRCGTFAE